MKYIYDKYNVYLTLFLNNLKYEEDAYNSFVEYNLEFQKLSGNKVNARYDFLTKELVGKTRVVKSFIDIPDSEIEELKECYYRYNFYMDAIADTKHYEYVFEKLDHWQKKYIEIFNKYGEFSEVNFIDKKIYAWG